MIERLRARRIVDDARAAAALVRARAGRRAWGDARLRAELERRGAGAACIDAALLEAAPERERARAWMAATRDARRSPARLARQLAARGFSADTVQALVEPLLDQGGDA